MSDASEEKKIIVDEDWKTQVEAEKEAAEHTRDEAGPSDEQLPPASFEMLISSFATQALIALGQIADPMDGKAKYHPQLAKHNIDMLDMLEQKTKGNLTAEEQKMISQVVHEMRMVFVAVSNNPPEPAPEEKKPTIETP